MKLQESFSSEIVFTWANGKRSITLTALLRWIWLGLFAAAVSVGALIGQVVLWVS